MDYFVRIVPATLAIAVSFVFLSAVIAGIGLLVRRGFGLPRADLDDCFLAFWIGFAIVLLFLLVWNFFFPVATGALTVVLVAGGLGLWRSWPALRALGGSPTGKLPSRRTALAVGLTSLWIANLSTGGMANWDTALYHMQGVEWAHRYPAVPGLANLFGPIGFNNSSLLFGALLSTGPWAGQAWHIANSLLVVVLVAQLIISGGRFFGQPAQRAPADLFRFLFLGAILSIVMNDELRSFVTDVSSTAVMVIAISLLYRSLSGGRRDPAEEAHDLMAIVVLSAAAVSIKMSAVVFATGLVVVAGGAWIGRGGIPPVWGRRTVRWSLTLAVAFAGAWTGRGVILSGYPAFPSQFLAAPVEWRVPAEHAQAEFDYVRHSTRSSTGNVEYVSGQIGGLAAWVPNWARHLEDDPYVLLIPVVMSIVMIPMILLAQRRATAQARQRTRLGWLILLPIVVGVVVWFVLAPAPRYLLFAFWAIPALLGSQAFALTAERAESIAGRNLAVAAFVLGFSPIVLSPLVYWNSSGQDSNPVRAVFNANFRIAGPGTWIRPSWGRPELTTYLTASGLAINVPKHRCWDGPLPCSPNPAPNLRLRVPGNLGKGFVVDGEWQMINWPQKWKAKFLPAWQASRQSAASATDSAR